MLNYLNKGETLPVTAPADLASGDFVLVGALCGFAVKAYTNGATAQILTAGQFTGVPKATGAAWAVGDLLYWDATNKVFTKTSSGNTKCAVATAVADSGAALGTLRLLPVAG